MSRRDAERLQDILDAITAIRSHLTRGELSDGLVFDAVRVRLIEIGEAVKAITPPGERRRRLGGSVHRWVKESTQRGRTPVTRCSSRARR